MLSDKFHNFAYCPTATVFSFTPTEVQLLYGIPATICLFSALADMVLAILHRVCGLWCFRNRH